MYGRNSELRACFGVTLPRRTSTDDQRPGLGAEKHRMGPRDPPLVPLRRLGLRRRRLVLPQNVPPDMYRPLVAPTDHPQLPPQPLLRVGRTIDQVDTPDHGLVDPSPQFSLERPRSDVPNPEDRPSFRRRDQVFPVR
jgi:hypothetical protein